MLSTSKLYTTNLTESLGAVALFSLIGYIVLAIKASLSADELENQFLEAYEDSLLTLTLDIDEEQIGFQFPSVTTHSNLFKRIVHNGQIDLVVNLKTANLLKQKFGKYPMFKILKTNESMSMDIDQFQNTHSSLLDTFISENKLAEIANKISDPNIRTNLLYIGKLLNVLMSTKVVKFIKQITFTSYKPKVTYNR